MSADLNDQPRFVNHHRAAPYAGAPLRLTRSTILVEVSAEDLLHVGKPRTIPSQGKHLPVSRDILPDFRAIGRLNLVNGIRLCGLHGPSALHVNLVGLN